MVALRLFALCLLTGSMALSARADLFPYEAVGMGGGNSTIELISPTDTESGTAKYLANRGEGVHHVAYEVNDIVAALAELKG